MGAISKSRKAATQREIGLNALVQIFTQRRARLLHTTRLLSNAGKPRPLRLRPSLDTSTVTLSNLGERTYPILIRWNFAVRPSGQVSDARRQAEPDRAKSRRSSPIDAKTGQLSANHIVQVMNYLYANARALEQSRYINLRVQVTCKGHTDLLPADALDDQFTQRLESWPETDRIVARGYTPGNQG